MNIAFFGTSDRSIPILNTLESNFRLSLCITKKDTIIGRKHKVRETAVKSWAKDKGIDYFEIENLKEPTSEALIEQLKCSNIEYGVVADFSLIIPESIIDYFAGKLINIHFSILPKYRGAAPIQFAILNGDRITGISYQLVHKKLDKGDLLQTIEYNMPDNKTAGEIYTDMFFKAAENLPSVLRDLENGKTIPMPQDEELATYTYSPSHPKRTTIFKEDAKIDWTRPNEKIERGIRAYNPWPIAWTTVEDLRTSNSMNIKFKANVKGNLILKIYSAHLYNDKLVPDTVQLEGKNITNWKDFLNGYAEN